MPAGGNGSEVVVERADRALVVRSADAESKATAFAAALPPEPSRTTVVVDASAAEALHALDERLLNQLRSRLYADAPPGWGMRLVAARAGRPDPSGAPPLAARLADRLGVGVVAPDGELIALRGGELFSAGPGAGWLGFRRGAHPEWAGPRYPAPAWQTALPREFRTAKPRALSRFRPRDRRSSGRVTVTAIPAGLWVRGAGTAPLPLIDLGFGIPVEPARPIVLVGAPGERVPGVAELVTFYEALPPAVRSNAVLVPYGQPPETCAALAQGVADKLHITLSAYHALPHYATDGTRRFAIFNTTGAPERLTQTPENVYTPASATTRPREPVLMPAGAPVAVAPVGGAPVGEAPVAGRFAAVRPDEGDTDFDDVDPVVFEASMDTPTQPIAALDDSAFAAPATEEPPGTAITVDASGFMRPAGRWPVAPVRPPGAFATDAVSAAFAPAGPAGHVPDVEAVMAGAGAPDAGVVPFAAGRQEEPAVAEARGGAAASYGAESASSDVRPNARAGVEEQAQPARPSASASETPIAFQTTASTKFPLTRRPSRATPVRDQPAAPGTPQTGRPPTSAEPVLKEIRATPDQVVWDPNEHGTRGSAPEPSPDTSEEYGERPAAENTARPAAHWAATTAPDGSYRRWGRRVRPTGLPVPRPRRRWSPPRPLRYGHRRTAPHGRHRHWRARHKTAPRPKNPAGVWTPARGRTRCRGALRMGGRAVCPRRVGERWILVRGRTR